MNSNWSWAIVLLLAPIIAMPASGDKTSANSDWSELQASMAKMHLGMASVKESGDSDQDFVRLMLPTIRQQLTWLKYNSFSAKIRKCAGWRKRSLPISSRKLN